jgi:hypothetical protein
MIVNFHTAPVDFDAICADLTHDGVVVIVTTRTNFSEVAAAVIDRMPRQGVLPLAVEGPDLDWHHYLINIEVENYEATATGKRVADAVAQWQINGSRLPYRAHV